MSENECSICNDNDTSNNLNCYTCDKSICIKCCNLLQDKSFINFKLKNELFIKYKCPYCRDFNNKNVKLLSKIEIINIFSNLLSKYLILQNNNEYLTNTNTELNEELYKNDKKIKDIINININNIKTYDKILMKYNSILL
tara:strand:+ start:32952 stop:33371 length:420 start_codon:yes stop_codon:yes gene_type:complete